VFPKDPQGFALDNQYYLGASGLLVKPVTTQGATETDVYLSDNEVWIRISLESRVAFVPNGLASQGLL
jgi:alpha-glucosidase (family GH31 glycosyl hydrolase)